MLAVIPASFHVLGVDVAHIGGPNGTNGPSYWENRRPTPLPASTGENCFKADDSGARWSGNAVTAASAYSQIVLKYATINTLFYDVGVGESLVPGTEQGISHVILCTGGSSSCVLRWLIFHSSKATHLRNLMGVGLRLCPHQRFGCDLSQKSGAAGGGVRYPFPVTQFRERRAPCQRP
jgi:hypothetical protein